MQIDEILERLDRHGYACSLINDDCGGWAVIDSGFEVLTSNDFEIRISIPRDNFRATIREAVETYMIDAGINLDHMEP